MAVDIDFEENLNYNKTPFLCLELEFTILKKILTKIEIDHPLHIITRLSTLYCIIRESPCLVAWKRTATCHSHSTL